eukprot:4228318-Lingulodinium_polyedra.AAC.1
MRLEEPLLWRGGCVVELWKGKGSSLERASYRDAWVEDLAAKHYHSFLRSQVVGFVEHAARDA